MSPPDSGFQHPSAPYWNSMIKADIMQSAGLLMPADPAEFDVDNLARADLDSFPGIIGGMDRFIEANRRPDLFLKLGVIDDVFIVQRLLEHHDVVAVHFLEELNIGEGVRRIRVTHETNSRK